MAKRTKRWSRSFGDYGARVRVFEERSGMLHGQVFDPVLKAEGKYAYRRVALGHKDRKEAVKWAHAQVAKLDAGVQETRQWKPLYKTVFAEYLRFRTPEKSPESQDADKRCAKMWIKHLGASKDLTKLSRKEWGSFCKRRASGAIDAKGDTVTSKNQRPVGPRTVEWDCHWLRAVCLWATTWQDDDGNYLLPDNPTRAFRKITPHEKNPKRPIASYDRYLKIREVSDEVMMDIRWIGKRIPSRSHLSELLDLAFFTGRRITAICELTHGDLRLDVGPYGSIRWPAASDKMSVEWENIPMEPGARKAIDRILHRVRGTEATGTTPLFPSPKDRSKPIRYELARDWLAKAEVLAEVPKLKGGAWHCYRRGWATARKTMSTKDVATLGGWGSEAVLKDVYQQADMAGMIEVIEAQAKLRDAR